MVWVWLERSWGSREEGTVRGVLVETRPRERSLSGSDRGLNSAAQWDGNTASSPWIN